jgi:hypothetical protein
MSPKTQKENTKDISTMGTSVAVILTKVQYIESEVGKINVKLEREYVTKDQFEPVKNIVYGLVSLILVAVVGALVALVIRK